MKLRVWLHRRGLRYSPSASIAWHQGTLFKPGKKHVLVLTLCTCAQAVLQGVPYDPFCPVHFPREV